MENKPRSQADRELLETTKKITKIGEELAHHPKSVDILFKLITAIDQSSPLRKFRDHWDSLPKISQWALMKSTRFGGTLFTAIGPVEYLIKLGLIEYKGDLDEDGQVMDEKIRELGGFENTLLKYGLRIGSWFNPEIKALLPFLETIFKFEEFKEELFFEIRERLYDVREEHENSMAHINAITSSIHKKIKPKRTTQPS